MISGADSQAFNIGSQAAVILQHNALVWLLVNGYSNIAHIRLSLFWILLRISHFWKDFPQTHPGPS